MKFFILATALVFSSMNAAEAATRFEIKQLVISEASDNGTVPVSLALAVAKVESDFNAKALSSAGARGVMQIMPQTAKGEFGVSANRLWNAELNIELGVRFLEQLYEQYDGRWELALSHYNGGTITNGRVHSFTQNYVNKVFKWQRVYEEQSRLWHHSFEEVEILEAPVEENWDEDLFYEWGSDRRSQFDDFEEDDFYADNTEIIIVERQRYRDWRRPPPPPHHYGHRGPRGRGFY